LHKRIRNNGFDIALGIIFVCFNLYLIYWLVITPPASNKIIGYIFILIWGFYSSLHLRAALIRRSYLKLSERIKVSQNDDKSIIIIEKTGEELVTLDNLKFIDLFYSWNTNPFSSDLQYARIELTTGRQIFITDYSIEIYKLEKVFKKKVRIVKNRFMNSLK